MAVGRLSAEYVVLNWQLPLAIPCIVSHVQPAGEAMVVPLSGPVRWSLDLPARLTSAAISMVWEAEVAASL